MVDNIEISVMRFKESGKYHDEIIIQSADLPEIKDSDLCWYLITEEIRKLRIKSGSNLHYLIGYSDVSVFNYYKDDIYPVIIKD